MRLMPWDPDIQTVISRIKSEALDLQPNFQRGEVWPKSKKQRLIDSVLREWHVPPIHVIENPSTRKQEVLDGQQRLAAIRDFVNGEFPVDGTIEPLDPKITELHGVRYNALRDDVKRQFDQFTLRVYRIIDFNPSEPAELFYRLNQPSNLTGAEQRNAFFGPVREQIRELVVRLESKGIGKENFGFSNARMAYDDVICRVALTLNRGNISTKITSNDLVELYRSEVPLSKGAYSLLERCLDLLSDASTTRRKPKFNKATLYTWLIFLARALARGVVGENDQGMIVSFIEYFSDYSETDDPLSKALLDIYDDRGTSRVADVSSIILRDVVVWAVFLNFCSDNNYQSIFLAHVRSDIDALILVGDAIEPELLARRALELGWGEVM